MKTITNILLITILAFFYQSATAQYPNMGKKKKSQLSYRSFSLPGPKWELGFGVGAANSITDIAARQFQTQSSILDVNARGMMPSASVYARYHTGNIWAIKGNLNASMLRANDKWSPDIEVVNRGKSFTNTVFEGSMHGELYMPRNYNQPKRDIRQNYMDTYIFSGLSVFYHNPQLSGEAIDDYDQALMDQSNTYADLQLAIPIGAGMKWNINNQWHMGLEFNFRYTFFDYLDGFTRPYTPQNDHYFTTKLNFGFIAKSKTRPRNQVVSRNVFGPRLEDR
ncbi:MAG: DUF6089 family protein [Bacteroidales bacterium]